MKKVTKNIFLKFRESCDRLKDKPALEILLSDATSRSYSYSQVLENVRIFSAKLQRASIREGDRVGLIAENSPEWVIAFFSILSINATAVLIDASLSNSELADFAGRSDLRGAMISPNVQLKFQDAGKLKFPLFNLYDQAEPFPGQIEENYHSLPGTSDSDPGIAAIFYSSGTTSTSKGVMHTHAGICEMAERNIESNRLTGSDRLLAILPLFHIYGFMANLVCPLFCGSSVYYLESVTSESLGSAFQKVCPTVFCAVPRVFDMFKSKILDAMKSKGSFIFSILNLFLKFSAKARDQLEINIGKTLFPQVHSSFGNEIRLLISGGTSIGSETVHFFYSLGFNLFNNYGITETNLPVAANSFNHFTIGTAGKPYAGVELRIKEPDGEGVGEILVRSPGLMKGYFRDPEATRLAFDDDGWFLTGDLGFFDAAGNLTVCGRLKENIIFANGKKVSPNDVESNYQGIRGVSDLVVCGIYNGMGSCDEVHAFVVKDGNLNVPDGEIESAVRAIGGELSPQMRISRLHFLNEIPRTSIRKPKRYLLKKMVENGELKTSGLKIEDENWSGLLLPGENFNRVLKIVSRFDFCKNPVTPQSRLYEDLGFDSLSVTEFCALLEKETGTSISKLIKPHLSIEEIVSALDNRHGASVAVNDKWKIPISKYPLRKGDFETRLLNAVGDLTKIITLFDVHGLDNLPDDGYILCPNHETQLDPMYVLIHLPETHRRRFCGLAKIELAESLLGRFVLRVSGGIPVNRTGDPGVSLRRCLEKLNEGWIVLIHPEGTRTWDGKLGVFKKGAAKLAIAGGKPLIPVRLKGGYEIFPRNSALPSLFNFSTLSRHRISISFGKPLFPEGHDSESLTRILRERILEL